MFPLRVGQPSSTLNSAGGLDSRSTNVRSAFDDLVLSINLPPSTQDPKFGEEPEVVPSTIAAMGFLAQAVVVGFFRVVLVASFQEKEHLAV